MISLLTGTIADLGADSATIVCNGVGYQVYCPTRSLGGLAIGQNATLHTFLSVREDALTLYGFTDAAEKRVFQMLTTVSGVGPKMALSLLSTFSGAEVMGAIHTGQPATLARASGVGKRLAEKIIVELKDRKTSLNLPSTSPVPASNLLLTDLISALANLGYPLKHAEAAVTETLNSTPDAVFEEAFKQSLKKITQHAGN